MLLLYETPGAEKCREYGKRFVNERLISLVKDCVTDYVQMCDDSYMNHIKSSSDWEKPLDEIIDLERLGHDENFFCDCLERYALVPGTLSPQRALHDFFSLYRLLKAKKEYRPDLIMGYILYRLIQVELDRCKDVPDFHEQVQRIPEPVRSQMMKELLVEAENYKKIDPETWEEEVPEIAEQMMSYYEDLEKYNETCFEDEDCFFLDAMDESEMQDSGFADDMGVNIKGDVASVKIEGNGLSFEFDVSAWDVENNDDLPF